MKCITRLLCPAFVSMLAMACPSQAQAVFGGTWKFDMAQSKFSPKPFTFYTSQGWYHCVSCEPPFDAAADGQEHPMTGQPFDAIAVTINDPQTITTVQKKDGKVIGEQTITVSSDEKTLNFKFIMHPPNADKPASFESVSKRQGALPAGVHATSGNWVMVKANGTENALLVTYKVDGDQITMTDPTGRTYIAKLDGSDNPVKGDPGWDTVSLKKIDDHTIEETDKFNGKPLEVVKMTVSGKTLTCVETDKPSDRVSTFVAKKQ